MHALFFNTWTSLSPFFPSLTCSALNQDSNACRRGYARTCYANSELAATQKHNNNHHQASSYSFSVSNTKGTTAKVSVWRDFGFTSIITSYNDIVFLKQRAWIEFEGLKGCKRFGITNWRCLVHGNRHGWLWTEQSFHKPLHTSDLGGVWATN